MIVKGPDEARWCMHCYAQDIEHINQGDWSVYKHSHMGDVPCTRPWSGLCQTEHGDICFYSCHPTQPEAMTALMDHIKAGKHIAPASGDQPTENECARLTTPAETKETQR